MVVLNKIYTRSGDAGTTALGTGARLPKNHIRIEAYGTVDEANAVIGVARMHLEAAEETVDAMLGRIQNDLFDVGADLCMPETGGPDDALALRITAGQVERLEAEIDLLNTELEPLRSFILPGGKPAAAHLHVARTVSRRAERLVVELAAQPDEAVGEPAVRYLNRLSDFLFVAARTVNDKGRSDQLWTPGENR